MAENPYAPSQASLSNTITIERVRPLSLSGGEVLSTTFRLMGENFWSLCGISILWHLITAFAGNSFFGLVAIPHLTAGLALAGYRYYRKQGALEHLFDGFQQFGPVLGFGLLLTIVSSVIVAVLVFLGIGAFAAWSVSTGMDPIQLLETETFTAVVGISVAIMLLLYLYHYMAGRMILVYPLIVYFNSNIGSAFSMSWKVTSASGYTIALQHMLFDFVFYLLGFIFFCVGVIPALGLMIAFRGAVCGPLLDHLYPEGAPSLSPEKGSTVQPSSDDRFKSPSSPSGPHPYS